MIIIETPTETHQFTTAEHELKTGGGTLRIRRNGSVIAAFREWTNYRITDTDEQN
jgi:hypothetical protein